MNKKEDDLVKFTDENGKRISWENFVMLKKFRETNKKDNKK